MKNRKAILFVSFLHLLCFGLSAQVEHPILCQSEEKHLVGEVGNAKVYLFDENDWETDNTDSLQVWQSHPQLIAIVETGNSFHSYLLPDQLSAAICQLIDCAEDNHVENRFEKVMEIGIRLTQPQTLITDIVYERKNKNLYAYWIYYWYHFHQQHDYSYYPPTEQDAQYASPHILDLKPTAQTHSQKQDIIGWQQNSYGCKAKHSTVYGIEQDSNREILLLSSTFTEGKTRFDLIVREQSGSTFFLLQHSFPVLLLQWDKLLGQTKSLQLLKVLCLVDVFYNSCRAKMPSSRQTSALRYRRELTKDLNKNISHIPYNCLNLLGVVTFTDGMYK